MPKLPKTISLPEHVLDLYCVRLSSTAPFCEKYAKLYFDTKHLEKGLNRGGGFGALFSKKVHFFHKQVPLIANIECCPKFLEYALFAVSLQYFKVSCGFDWDGQAFQKT